MDDFWGFVNPDSECCRVDPEGAYVPIETGNETYTTLRSSDDTCLASSETVPPVPEEHYMSLFSMFATASAGTSCSYGGGSIYRGQFSIDTDPVPVVNDSTPAVKLNSSGYGNEITAWSYMVTGTANPTQQRYIDSYKQNLRAAEWISEKTGVDIWVYCLTYVYFEQYLTVVDDAYKLIGLALAAIFVVTTLYLGSIFYSLVIALTATNIVVYVLGLMQPLDIMLNGLSIVNLIIAAGIAVEFCGHYVRFFAKARGTGDERARDALRQVLTSVLFGITITKVIGLSVLTLADSRVFKKYYFRMYMMVVVCGVLNEEAKKALNMSDEVPPLVAMAVRYSEGDDVKTPFGPGRVRRCSDRQTHVEVSLAGGIVLYARRGCLVPELRMLQCGEIPRYTHVLLLGQHTEPGQVLDYIVPDQKYKVQVNDKGGQQEQESRLLTKEELRLAKKTRVRTQFGLGSITDYRGFNDSYAVELDWGSVGFFQAKDVACVDLRLLAKFPKPLSADRIYQEFQGRITQDDALVLSCKARQTYRQVQIFCEQHAEAISFISTNASYGDQYSRALASMLDPSFSDATQRLKTASGNELKRLKEMAVSAKRLLESDLLEGKDTSEFIAKATNVLSQLKNSEEVKNLHSSLREKANAELASVRNRLLTRTGSASSPSTSQEEKKLVLSEVLQVLETKIQAEKPRLDSLKSSLQRHTLQSKVLTKMQQHETDLLKAQETIARLESIASKKMGVNSLADLDPTALAQKAEEFLPKLSNKAGILVQASEKYWLQMQQTSEGQTLMKKAKTLVASVDNPDEFCSNVTKAIGEVKLDKLAEWGSTMSKNREKRQAFVNRMKDHCLDFFTSVLPTIKIDTISGVQDDITYSISKLDLSHFRVKKEKVKVRMGTVVDEELFTVHATHLTALLKRFDWTFEQKYFPYLHGGGVADAELSGGVISLGFKAERKVVNNETGEFKPILVLNSMSIEIRQELKLTVQGSWFSAVYNMLTSLFAELIREYLAKTMESKLLKHMIKLLNTLNKQMDEYWPLIFQLLDIRMEDLPTASPWRGAKEVEIRPQELECTFLERNSVPFAFTKGVLNKYVVVSRVLDVDASSDEADDNHDFHLTSDLKRVPVGSSVLAINGLCCSKLTLEELKGLLNVLPLPFTMRFSLLPEDPAKNRQPIMKAQPEVVSFAFKQEGPLGLRLRARPLASCGVIVVGFADPSKVDGKKSAAELSGKIRVGQLLMKVNDEDLRFKSLPEVLNILRDLKTRPVTMQFAASPDAIIKLRDWPPMIELEDASSFACEEDDPPSDGRKYVVISTFSRVPSFAQRTHVVEKGDVLLHVDGMPLTGPAFKSFAQIMETLRVIASKKEPMHAVFVGREHYVAIRKQIQHHGLFEHNSSETNSSKNKDVRDDRSKALAAEEDTVPRDASAASPTANNGGDLLSSVPTKDIVFPKAPLGILFGNWKDEAIYIRAFISSPGPAEKTGILRPGHAILQVCGHAVPRQATPTAIDEMIMKITVESRAQPGIATDNTTTDPTVESSSNKKTKYTLTVRDLELEQELMKADSQVN